MYIWVSLEVWRTGTHSTVVDYTANGSGGTGCRAWVHTLVPDTGVAALTVAVEDTLGSTPNIRVAKEAWTTLADVGVEGDAADSVGAAGVRVTRVEGWGRWLR